MTEHSLQNGRRGKQTTNIIKVRNLTTDKCVSQRTFIIKWLSCQTKWTNYNKNHCWKITKLWNTSSIIVSKS